MHSDCLRELFDALDQEIRHSKHSSRTGRVEIAPTITSLPNGLRRCVVQILSESGSARRVEMIGNGADDLFRTSMILKDFVETDTAMSDLQSCKELLARVS